MTADPADLIPAYLDAGIAVLPLHWPVDGRSCSCGRQCPTPAKHPLSVAVRHGSKDATLDPGQAAEWLARWPEANWGVVPPPGVAVLDIDPRHQGDERLAELEVEFDELPATLTARTGSGGEHRWFLHDGERVRGKLADGLDVKTSAGYLVAPPSRHMSGGRYEWTVDEPIVPAPRWLALRLSPPVRYGQIRGPASTSIDGLAVFLARAVEGERNGRLYWCCCRALDAGLGTDALVEVAVARLGCDRAEAENTAESAEKRPPRKGAA